MVKNNSTHKCLNLELMKPSLGFLVKFVVSRDTHFIALPL